MSPMNTKSAGPLTWLDEQKIKKVLSDAELFEVDNERSLTDGLAKAKN
jgi:hypothetical protein